MAITNGYATLDEFKLSILANITTVDTARDTLIEKTIEAASREIDGMCNRFFFVTSATARYYTAAFEDLLFPDDISATTSFAIATDNDGDGTYENTWASTDYNLSPYQAFNGWPFLMIETTPQGNYSFPVGVRKGVKVTALWGWAVVPKEIQVATLLQAHRLYARYKTPLGVSASSAVGEMKLQIPSEREVREIIKPFVRTV